MQTSHTITEIMEALVSVQSDTGTPMEQAAAKKIISYFAEDPYFRAHPDCFGMEDTGDFMGRPVVWALKRGTTDRTLILTGHYDAVEINCYGDLKPFALQPQKLREEILRQKLGTPAMQTELASGDWLPGRGTADMKVVRRARAMLQRGECVLIYPEGTRVKDDAQAKVHGGYALMAQMAKAPVQPVAVIGARNLRVRSRVWLKAGRPVEWSEIDAPKRREQVAKMEEVGMGRVFELRDELRQAHPGLE